VVSGDTNANFALVPPEGADVKTKALLLAATILLDYEIFQERPQGQQGFAGTRLNWFN